MLAKINFQASDIYKQYATIPEELLIIHILRFLVRETKSDRLKSLEGHLYIHKEVAYPPYPVTSIKDLKSAE